MVGSGDRSEKDSHVQLQRESGVSDHRIGLTIHQLDLVMEGKPRPVHPDALVAHFQAEAQEGEPVPAWKLGPKGWFGFFFRFGVRAGQ